MRLPRPRGALSEQVIAALRDGTSARPLARIEPDLRHCDVLADEDFHCALWILNELHYRGFADAASDHEWDPDAVALRGTLERAFETRLRECAMPYVEAAFEGADDLVDQILFVIGAVEGPNLAAYLQREASRDQVVEFMRQRSLYHLKESDPHAFVLPRLDGRAKVALAELQYDEYGAGRPDRMHATLFGDALEGCGLDRGYGAYVDQVPGHTLAVNNVMSLFGLHRRARGAALGHLTAFECTSSVPCRRIAAGIERVGLPAVVAAYFHEHVEADAVHEQIAMRDICVSFVEAEPELRADVLFGVAACLYLDVLAASALLDTWRSRDDVLEAQDVAS